jgi:hypothetical protein
MLRATHHEVEEDHLHGTEYVTHIEVWGDGTHGIQDYRGQRVDLSGGRNTIYWYRVTIAEKRGTEAPAE